MNSRTVRQLSSSERTIIDPSFDCNAQEINAKVLLLNIFVLYGFGAIAQIIPNTMGVFRRGFFCNDESIMYSYKSDTIPIGLLISYSLMINLITILSVEIYRIQKLESSTNTPRYRWRNNNVKVLLVRLVTNFGYSQVGFICSLTLTCVTKNVVGRLRPHFLDICQPLNLNCSEHEYVTNYVCNGDAAMETESRKSFFSGHSSIAMYCSVFSVLYIQAKLKIDLHHAVITPLLQTIIISVGLVICYTRVNDNMHHWSDVLVGGFVGTFCALYTSIFWAHLFQIEEREAIHSLVSTSSYSTLLNDDTAQRISHTAELENSVEERPTPSGLQSYIYI